MNVRSAYEANAKTTESMEPRMSPFDNPTEFAGAAAVFGAAPGDERSDAAFANPTKIGGNVVCFNGLFLAQETRQRATGCGTQRRKLHEKPQLSAVIGTRTPLSTAASRGTQRRQANMAR